MGTTSQSPAATSPRRRRLWPWIVGAVGVVVLLAAVAVALAVRDASRPVPDFPELADDPDPAITGTVAYTAPDLCVRVVAAAGAPSKEVLCIEPQDMGEATKVGKPAGPQLHWRDDGRLEITMFRWKPTEGDTEKAPDYEPAWQKLVDVRTGEVEEVAAADLPAKPRAVDGPATNADGQRIVWSSDPGSGNVEVKLEDHGTTRTLLDVNGPSKYRYGLQTAYWAPSGDWVVADDGRILVITTGSTPETRVLVSTTGMAGGGTVGPTFAVTDADLLGG